MWVLDNRRTSVPAGICRIVCSTGLWLCGWLTGFPRQGRASGRDTVSAVILSKYHISILWYLIVFVLISFGWPLLGGLFYNTLVKCMQLVLSQGETDNNEFICVHIAMFTHRKSRYYFYSQQFPRLPSVVTCDYLQSLANDSGHLSYLCSGSPVSIPSLCSPVNSLPPSCSTLLTCVCRPAFFFTYSCPPVITSIAELTYVHLYSPLDNLQTGSLCSSPLGYSEISV